MVSRRLFAICALVVALLAIGRAADAFPGSDIVILLGAFAALAAVALSLTAIRSRDWLLAGSVSIGVAGFFVSGALAALLLGCAGSVAAAGAVAIYLGVLATYFLVSPAWHALAFSTVLFCVTTAVTYAVRGYEPLRSPRILALIVLGGCIVGFGFVALLIITRLLNPQDYCKITL